MKSKLIIFRKESKYRIISSSRWNTYNHVTVLLYLYRNSFTSLHMNMLFVNDLLFFYMIIHVLYIANIYIYTYTHTYTHIHIYMYVHAKCIFMYVHVECIHACASNAHMHVYAKCVHMHTYIHLRVSVTNLTRNRTKHGNWYHACRYDPLVIITMYIVLGSYGLLACIVGLGMGHDSLMMGEIVNILLFTLFQVKSAGNSNCYV